MARVSAIALALCATTSPLAAHAQKLSDSQVDGVVQRLAEGATHSWELGTRAQALLELNSPAYSVLTANAAVPPSSNGPVSLSDVLGIAKSVVANLTNTSTVAQPLISGDGAAGDPASLGVAVLIANLTGQTGEDYGGAAADQLQYLLEKVPRTSDGAISHRVSQVQLWSDFVYMVPPFLAYYGVLSRNESLIQEAYVQCQLYRQYLRDDAAGGLWKHILLGDFNDAGHWSTGNAWAAAGMLRVLGTIQRSSYAKDFTAQQSSLVSWVSEIHDAMYAHLPSSALFNNYVDANNSFADASGTTLLAASVYRLALMAGVHTHLPNAEKSRTALFGPSSGSSSSSASSSSSSSSSSTTAPPSSLAHFDGDMWLTPVVNPNSFGDEGSQSPEGQAFVVELHSAYRDWVAAGSPGANAATARRAPALAAVAAVVLAMAVGLIH
ncbi:Six-hairpin glycosidase-like protein [Epithele typhae]|uniref:Six-hairpin glycosidase-like protein n=1 Tax=Epithele typhae TaxID=378194 RepID=UPI00200878D5|nr:Six-hairpin glycosidase-like protein [Epithele typhae]KAH9911354.1 Six-hairpin glycosidase-like protein [Epithele typhae]